MTRVTPFRSAGIILSYQCSSRCRHCLYSGSSEWRDWIEPEMLRAIYRGTRDCAPGVRGFHLAGGEAFLRFPILLEAVRLAGEYGIPLDYVETNAHWFTDRSDAVAKLRRLRGAGLECLLISASPHHAEHIPLEKTRGLIAASSEVFGPHGTLVWLHDFLRELTAIRDHGTIPWSEYVERVGPARAHWAALYGGQLVPGGRAPYGLEGMLPLKPLEACLDESCEHELLECGHGHYDLYGNIIPSACSGISLGDAGDLPAFVRDFSLAGKPVLEVLVRAGVRGLYEMARADFGYEATDAYAGKCHLCMDIRRHLVLRGASFSELAPAEFYHRV